MKDKKKIGVLIVPLILITSLLVVSEPVMALIERENEFSKDVLFKMSSYVLEQYTIHKEKKWDLKKNSYVKLGFDFSLGEFHVNLPTTIKATYDTTLEQGETNPVDMVVETHDGDGPEFEFFVGFRAWIEYDPPGPSWLGLGKRRKDFGKFISIESDFKPPLSGEEVTLERREATFPFTFFKVITVDVGIATELTLRGDFVHGDAYENDYSSTDDGANLTDTGATGVKLPDDVEQFNITQPLQNAGWILNGDWFADFGVENLTYKIKIFEKISPVVRVSIDWVEIATWDIYWAELPGQEFYISGSPGSIKYRMQRIPFGLITPPIFHLGTVDAYGLHFPKLSPGSTVMLNIPIMMSSFNVSLEEVDFFDTTIDFYYENETVPYNSITLTQSNWTNMHGYNNMTAIVQIPLYENVTGYHSIDIALNNITIRGDFNGTGPEDVTALGSNASFYFTYALPDLDVGKLAATTEGYEPYTPGTYPFEVLGLFNGTMAKIEANITNRGRSMSSQMNISLWIYPGVASHPINITDLISGSTLYEWVLREPLLESQSHKQSFYWYVDSSWIDQNITFIVKVQSVNQIIDKDMTEVDNYMLAPGYVMFTATGMNITYWDTYYSFRYLFNVYGSNHAQTVSLTAEEAINNNYTRPNEFINAMHDIAGNETLTIQELAGKVPDDILSEYSIKVGELSSLTTQLKTETNGSKVYLGVLKVMDLQSRIIILVEKIPAPVGGIHIPVNKLELLAPYIGLAMLLAVAAVTVGYVKKRKRQ